MVRENRRFCRRTRSVGTLLPVSLNVYSRRSNLCHTRPNAPYRIRAFGVVWAKVRVVSPNHQGSVSHSQIRMGGIARIVRHAMPASENGGNVVRAKTASVPRASVATHDHRAEPRNAIKRAAALHPHITAPHESSLHIGSQAADGFRGTCGFISWLAAGTGFRAAHGKWSGTKNGLRCNMQIIIRDSPRFQVRAGNRIRPLARGRRGRTMIGQCVPLLQCLVFSNWRKAAR